MELERALRRAEAGQTRIVPVYVREAYWKGAPFAKLQALPKDAKPVTAWPFGYLQKKKKAPGSYRVGLHRGKRFPAGETGDLPAKGGSGKIFQGKNLELEDTA